MGSGDFAVNAELRDGLRKDFDREQITKLDKGFGKIDTLNHAVVTDRLNHVAPGWTYSIERIVEVRGHLTEIKDSRGKTRVQFGADELGLPHVIAVYGSMTIGTVTRFEVGEVENFSAYGDELKKALSDFIKRAAMRFGVGIALWSKGDLPPYERTVAETDEGSATDVGSGSTVGERSEPDPTQPDPTASPFANATLTDAFAERAEALAAMKPEPAQSVLTAPPPDIDPVEANVASAEQWERLRAVVGGSEVRAVNRLNKTNGTAYTKETAAYATAEEVGAAITGEKP